MVHELGGKKWKAASHSPVAMLKWARGVKYSLPTMQASAGLTPTLLVPPDGE